jgi:hypothetical protein
MEDNVKQLTEGFSEAAEKDNAESNAEVNSEVVTKINSEVDSEVNFEVDSEAKETGSEEKEVEKTVQVKNDNDSDNNLSELEKRCADYETKICEMQKDFALQLALQRAGARNVKAAMALIDRAAIAVDKGGNVVGVEEQIEALKADGETAFLFKDNSLKGLVPQENARQTETESGAMTYAQLCEIYK